MRVNYYPKGYRPPYELEHEVCYLFSLLHVLEPIEKLTLTLVEGDGIQTREGTICWAAYDPNSNTILLPTHWHDKCQIPREDWEAFVLWNLQHEFVHAIRERDGRDTGHRGFDNEMMGLYNRLLRET